MILDQWNLDLGQDLAAFIERGLSASCRVLCICSEGYVRKANEKQGGVGYEKRIITSEILSDSNTDWVIPVVRNNTSGDLVPKFLGGCLYVDFLEDRRYEEKYEELLRSLLDEPILPVPAIGKNPFETIREFANQKFIPSSEKYSSPARRGALHSITRTTMGDTA